MRIAIVGAGAMGSLVAGLLCVSPQLKDDDEIWLVGGATSQEHFTAIARHGLRFEIRRNVTSVLPTPILARLQEPLWGLHLCIEAGQPFPCDLAVVLVKSYRTVQAAQQVAQLLGADGLVLSLQNGLGNVEMLATSLPATSLAQVTQGTSLLGASLGASGQVIMGGLGSTTCGLTPRLTPKHLQSLERFKILLEGAGAPVHITDNVESVIWGKLVVNCAVNPVAALLNLSNGAVLEYAASRQLITDVALEVARVAQAAGIKLPFPDEQAPAQAMSAARINAENICSMVQDLRKGRPTEIEAINGAVVRVAARLGIAAPINRTLTELIRVREQLGSLA